MLQSIPDPIGTDIVNTDIIAGSAVIPVSDTIQITPDNIIFIGNKPVMSYVLAIVTQFQNGQEEVIVRGRGKAISRAVDAVEIAIHKFLPQIEKQQITTCTEEIETEDGMMRVSVIEFVLTARGKKSNS